MKIAISTDEGQVSAHFGRCPEFTILDIEGDKLINKEVLANPGHQPGFLPQFLHEKGVACIVAGGMGPHAQQLFAEKDIKTIVGVSASIEQVINDLLAGTLNGGESLCKPGEGKGYGVEKSVCDHAHEKEEK